MGLRSHWRTLGWDARQGGPTHRLSRVMVCWLPGECELAHDAMPVPAQVSRSLEATHNVQEHPAKSSFGKLELHIL
jgi:hypothetical protein